MNRKMIIVVALLLAVVAVVGIWMPQIREWQDKRAYRKERQRTDEGYAFGQKWMNRMDFFKVQRTPEETDKWYKQAKKEFCSDPDRQKMNPNVEATLELTLFSYAPEHLSCSSDISSNNPQ